MMKFNIQCNRMLLKLKIFYAHCPHMTFNYLSNTISLLSGGTATAPTRCSPAITGTTWQRTRRRSPPPRCCCSASSSPRSPPRARPPWWWRAGGCGPGTSTSRAPPPARTTTPPSTRPRPSPPSTPTAPPATPTTGQPSPGLALVVSQLWLYWTYSKLCGMENTETWNGTNYFRKNARTRTINRTIVVSCCSQCRTNRRGRYRLSPSA